MEITALELERDSAKLRIVAAIAVHDGAAAKQAQDEVDEINAKIGMIIEERRHGHG